MVALVAGAIGQSDEELATGESVEVSRGVALYPLLVPDFAGLTLSIDLSDDLVKIAGGVHILPEGFTVSGIVAAGVVLLSAVVDEGNAETGHGEHGGGAETLLVATVVAHEAGVVVVVNEETEKAQVAEVVALS